MFRAKVGGPEKQSSSSSPGLFPNPDGPGVWRGTEGGQLPSGVTLYLAASMCRSAAVLSPLSGKPRVLKWPASCPQEELAYGKLFSRVSQSCAERGGVMLLCAN